MMDDFDAVLAGDDLWILLRRFGSMDPYARRVDSGHAEICVEEDVTAGIVHRAVARSRPSDPASARWVCSCGVKSKGTVPTEDAVAQAAQHERESPDARSRPRDVVVDKGRDGSWAQREALIYRRFRAVVRARRSDARIHRSGVGEDFELAVDSSLHLWVRRLGNESALRRDQDGRGASIVVFEADD